TRAAAAKSLNRPKPAKRMPPLVAQIAHSADPDQPFRPIAITDSGDPDHAVHYARGRHGRQHDVALDSDH
ncbi:MAG TPA: hypothetical protein VHX44_19680, partial [Planctomycetota bacterium]|nr:hypothetical protein [Planctomycetota bacterium]